MMSYAHIYREKNKTINSLSEECIQLAQGEIKISKMENDSFFHYYHRPFQNDQEQYFC